MTGGELLIACLKQQGVRAVFGMPGTQNIHIYDALLRTGQEIGHYLIRNEQAATLLAGGFARATGEVGVAITVPGPGASNASTGILDAYTDCQSVLLITGGYDRPLANRDRSKMFHGLNQQAFFAPITRYFGCPQTADEIPAVVEKAFRAIRTGRPGPAVIEMPPDLAAEESGEAIKVPSAVRPAPDRRPDDDAVSQAAAKIAGWQRPAILVGSDVIASGAPDALREVAELLQSPVIETRLGKGVISAEHPLYAGHCRDRHCRDLLQQSDGLLAVGVRFTQIDTSNWRAEYPRSLVQFDRDPGELGREVAVDYGVDGDLKAAMKMLLEELKLQGHQADHPEWAGRFAQKKREAGARAPVPVLSQIRQALPRDGILSCDVTSLGYRAFGEYPVYGPRQFFYSCYSVALGSAFPHALGAKIACPDRPVVSFSGDGGFLMTAYELATAVEHRIGVVAIVAADGALLAIKAAQEKAFAGRSIDTDMHIPDFVSLAKSYGAAAERVENFDDLVPAIQTGLDRQGPTVLEVPLADRIDEIKAEIPWLQSRESRRRHRGCGRSRPIPRVRREPTAE
jgi:acetolactate synthase-1/2/3 large subunit